MTDYPLHERTLDEKTIYKGKIVHLKELVVELPNGHQSKREVVYHPGAVGVIASPKPGYMVFVEQFRKGPEEVLLELPAGKLEPGEDRGLCALRELAEETGYEGTDVKLVYEFFTSPGFADEKISLYFVTGIVQGEVHPDEDEFVNVKLMSRQEVMDALNDRRFRDAKTLVGVMWWLQNQ